MAYLILASVIWAFSFGIIKSSLAALDPSFVGWARLLISLALFVPFLRRAILREGRLCARLMTIGAVQYGLMYSLYLAAFAYLDAHQVALFTVFTPIYVILWSDLRRGRPRISGLACAAIAAVGAGLLRCDAANLDDDDLIRGFLLIQAANLCFAAGQVEYRRLRQQRPELRDLQVHGWLLLGGLAVTTVATTLGHGWPSLRSLDPPALAALAYLGLIASGVGFFAWNAGAVRTAPATLAVLNNLKIPLAVAASLIFFGEATDIPTLLAGGGLMIVAAILAQRYAAQPPGRSDGEPPPESRSQRRSAPDAVGS